MIPRYLAVAVLAIVLPLTGLAAGSSPCSSDPALGPAGGVHPVGAPGDPSYYVDVRAADPFNVWIYEETNTMADLQRGGSSSLMGTDHDSCVDVRGITPDQLIY
ncbi:MAG: hypothetical protein WDA16_11530 [Candidatus Thermoplasmatota archaeon]